jgi:uncharacterized protein (DUF885 family)
MRKLLKWTGITLGVLLLLATGLFVQTWYFRPFSIDVFFERVFIQFALREPELLTQLGLLRQAGYRGLDDVLGDVSPAHEADIAALVRNGLETLRAYDRAKLSTSQQLSYDVLEWYLVDQVEGERWLYHNYPVNQLFGAQNETPNFMIQFHPLDDVTDARNYNARLGDFSRKFAGLMDGLKLRESKGIVPPKFVIGRVLTEMRAFIAPPAKENVLYTHLRDRLAKLDSVPAAERTPLLDEAARQIEASVYPAYRSLIAFFEHLEQTVHEDYGVWKLPDGEAFYDYVVRSNTTTSLSAEEVHQLGLAEVARLEQEMGAILSERGFTEGTISARIDRVEADPAQHYPNDDAGRAQCIADFQRYIDEMIAGLAPAFDLKPKLNIRVERVPPFRELTAPGAYAEAASLDGSRPSVFRINLRDMNEIAKFGMRTLAYHESVPGHQFEGALSQALSDVPTFRKVVPFTAYNEGWALYAERLAWEMGFQNDPLDNLGRLQAEMMRAVRLVVDTGIHRKRWTREQAIDYMIEKTGMSPGEVTSEIERYFVDPGQALAYKVGMQKILDLRAHAQRELGPQFDLKGFHGVVLGNGELPLSVLEAEVNRWIVSRK